MAEAHYLVAYDVVDSRRRRRTAKVAYSYALGGQKSALETILDAREKQELLAALSQRIDEEEDRVHLLRVRPRAILLGRAKQLDFRDGAILI
jgi:CRISPR-associated endonuclease Cas2